MENTKQIIEINGIKLEVDLREAVVIDNYKVGDVVKVLVKEYSDNYNSYMGQIIGFDNFKTTPTINIAYIKPSYSTCELVFLSYNSNSKDIEITKDFNQEYRTINKQTIIDKFDTEKAKHLEEIRKIEWQKQYFIDNFNKYFKECITQ